MNRVAVLPFNQGAQSERDAAAHAFLFHVTIHHGEKRRREAGDRLGYTLATIPSRETNVAWVAETLAPEIAWIEENSKGSVATSFIVSKRGDDATFFFERQEDAALFKLFWC